MAFLESDDLPRIKAELDAEAASALQWLFPAGRLVRNEFQVGDVAGTPGSSLKFNVRKLKGKDWSAGERGFAGVLSVFIAHAGSVAGGLDLARRFLGIPAPERPQPKKGAAKGRGAASDAWTQIIPAPVGVGRPEFARLWPKATFLKAWDYRDASGRLLFYVARYEWEELGEDGEPKLKKLTPVVTYGHDEDGRRRWRAKGTGRNVLFGLEELAARPDAPVLIVEGEKAAERARLLFPDWVVLAWKGGAGNAKNIDVSPLDGRDVVLWPDADRAGSEAMRVIGRRALKAGADVRLVVLPPGLPDGWDLGDTLPLGWTRETLEGLVAGAEVRGRCRRAAPHHAALALPADRASAMLERTVREWVAHAVTHAEGEPARQVGIKAAAGLGKSRALLRALQARPEALERHFDILVPQHRLADEMAQEAAGGPLPVKAIRGRGYERADGSTMCAKAEEAEKVARAGFNVQETMCRRVDPETGQEETCEHFASCLYIAQFTDPTPAVRIMPHDALFLPRNSGLPKPQAVVIDESFFAKAVRRTNFALDRLTAGLPWRMFGRKVDISDLDRRDRIARAVRRALEAGEHPRDHGVTVEDCQFAARLEFGGIEGIGITPGMSHAAQRKRLESYRRGEALKLYRFWKLLEAEIGRSGSLRQIELRRNVIGRDGEACDRVYLFWCRELELPDVPVLVLDADLDPTIVREFLPRLEVAEVPVERRAEVIQVRDTACSRRRLLAWEGAPEDEVSRAANRLADVQALLDVEASRGSRVLVVTYKPAAERLKAPEGCAVEWFGNIRGIDRYKHFDTVIIAGREQPPTEAIEAQARALFADDPEPINLTGELVQVERGYRMRDGSQAAALVWVHPDARVQALLEQVREREMTQAIDRLRLIHRPTPARVIVLSSVVLDLTVDRLTTWREIMPTRLERAAARGSAVPLSASELARCFPDLWATAKAAEREQDKSPLSHIEVLYGKGGVYPARYRRAGQKRPTPALIRADAGDARAALEAVVGPVVWFEVETPEMVRLEAPNRPAVEFGKPALRLISVGSTFIEIAGLHLILDQAGRLEDLSARLEKFRPPPPEPREQVPRRVAG